MLMYLYRIKYAAYMFSVFLLKYLLANPGEEFDTYAKVVINAAGPFCDFIRKLVDKAAPPMISPSSGVHIVLPDYYSPEGMGLIVPKTKDGRVVFMLPWLGRTLAGTTDSNTILTMLPEPHEDEIQFILDALSDYLCIKVSILVSVPIFSNWANVLRLVIYGIFIVLGPSLVGRKAFFNTVCLSIKNIYQGKTYCQLVFLRLVPYKKS